MRHKTLTRLPKIRAQYFVPVGRECRPAYWLQYMGLRDGALPFDWMIISGFDLIVRTLKQGCRFWFNTYKEWPSNEDIHRIVADETINLRSLHHFPKDESIAEYLPKFYDVFDRRVERLRKIFTTSRKVCLVCDQNEDVKTFMDFADQLHEMYPKLKIVTVQIAHNTNKNTIEFYKYNKWFSLYVVYGKDENELGITKAENPKYHWVGSKNLWCGAVGQFREINYKFGFIPIEQNPSDRFCAVIADFLSKWRIDIKNFGGESNAIKVLSLPGRARANFAGFLRDENGSGVVISGKNGKNLIQIKSINSGVLKIFLRGIYKLCEERVLPLYTDYESVKINGREILNETKAIYHNRPFKYEVNVADNDIVTIEINSKSHKYRPKELSELIEKLLPDIDDILTPKQKRRICRMLQGDFVVQK